MLLVCQRRHNGRTRGAETLLRWQDNFYNRAHFLKGDHWLIIVQSLRCMCLAPASFEQSVCNQLPQWPLYDFFNMLKLHGNHDIQGKVWTSCVPPLNDQCNHSTSSESPMVTWSVLWWHKGGTTRRSENDNTPQPLDQWTNSPFIGIQVGNCKSFTLTHYLADLFAMHRGPRSIPLCIQHHIQLTSLSVQVSRPSHS